MPGMVWVTQCSQKAKVKVSAGRDPFLEEVEEDTLSRLFSLLAELNSMKCRTVSLLAWGISLLAARGDTRFQRLPHSLVSGSFQASNSK